MKKITVDKIEQLERRVYRAREGIALAAREEGLVPWIQHNLYIKPKQGGIQPFVLNKFQKKICAHVVKNLKRKKASRIIILKSRQLGMSTVAEAIIFYLLHTFPHTTGLVLAHTEKAAANVYQMTKRFYNNLPPSQKRPLVGQATRVKMEWAHPHGSVLYQFTAGGQEIGRSWTINWVHASEMAFYPQAHTVMTALNQTVPDPEMTHMSCYIIESTAQGLNLFHDYWERAQSPDSIWEPFFFSWKDDPLCTSIIKEDPKFDSEELAFQAAHGLTDGQLLWARNVRLDQCNGSWATFHQEYPATPELAFISTGLNVFDLSVISPQMKRAEQERPLIVGNVRSKSITVPSPEIVSDAFGPLSIWEHPTKDAEYVIGADCSEGIGAAYSEAVVLKKQPPQQVAHYRSNTVKPTDFGVVLWLLGAYYKFALLGVERNAVGQAVLAVLEHGHGDRARYPYMRRYPNLYYELIVDEKVVREGKRIGYSTSSKTRQSAIVRLSEAIAHDDILLRSIPLLEQLAGFIWDPERQKYVQVAKDKVSELRVDDGVFALAIAWEMLTLDFKRGFCVNPLREVW